MNRTVTATEAKARLSELMRWAVDSGNDVIVESRGAPQVVLVPFTEYTALQDLKERVRREDALAQLRALAQEVQAQNDDLSEDEIAQLADEISREAVQRLVDKGIVRFES
ncbi:MAG: type II toxin-antitoxin system Phd/YefM family antitoxin [Chloroflexota bacterium]